MTAVAIQAVYAADIVACARTYIGTRFHHQGRVKGRGIDCVGLVIGIAHELGLSDFDTRDYARSPMASEMTRLLCEHMDPVPIDARRDGDVLHLALKKDPQHLAILAAGGSTIIHAYANPSIRRCCEHPFGPEWLGRLHGVYRYRGLAD